MINSAIEDVIPVDGNQGTGIHNLSCLPQLIANKTDNHTQVSHPEYG
jgi:hypothetical protein